MQPYFLNVDLEIQSASNLDALVSAMGKRVLIMYSGPGTVRRHLLALEISRCYKSADATIRAFCNIVESLPPSARKVWNKSHKEFDVGYELRVSEKSSRFSLGAHTLGRVARLGAFLTVTYYRGDEYDP